MTEKIFNLARGALNLIARYRVYIYMFIIALVLLWFVVSPGHINGDSMYPALNDGDIIIRDKIIYKLHGPERYDIVVFRSDDEEQPYYIKRVIGLPGERIRISEEGEVYINGELLEENFWGGPLDDAGIAEEEITLGEDEVFCLGDNSQASLDSRYFGPVKISDIEYHCYMRVWPLNKIGLI